MKLASRAEFSKKKKKKLRSRENVQSELSKWATKQTEAITANCLRFSFPLFAKKTTSSERFSSFNYWQELNISSLFLVVYLHFPTCLRDASLRTLMRREHWMGIEVRAEWVSRLWAQGWNLLSWKCLFSFGKKKFLFPHFLTDSSNVPPPGSSPKGYVAWHW